MKLNEINQHHDTIDAVANFVNGRVPGVRRPFTLAAATVNTYGSVDITSSVHLRDFKGTELPFRFGTVDGHFDCTSSNLTSMKNFPIRVGSYVSICDCVNITSLEGLPQVIGGAGLVLSGSGITSLAGTEKIFKNLRFSGMAEVQLSTDKIKEGGISLIFAKNIENLWDGIVTEPFQIIQKYLGKPDDIFECQAELIEHGFEEYAKL